METILKGTNARTIPVRFGSVVSEEDLNVKVYDGRGKPSVGKSSPDLWQGELKWER